MASGIRRVLVRSNEFTVGVRVQVAERFAQFGVVDGGV